MPNEIWSGRGNAHAYPTQFGKKATTVAALPTSGIGARYPKATSISAGGKGPASFFAIGLLAPSAPTNQAAENSLPLWVLTIQPSSLLLKPRPATFSAKTCAPEVRARSRKKESKAIRE